MVIPDIPHHIVQRGNNRQDVFFVDDDRRVYLSFLRERGVSKFERILGRRLRPLPIGRPGAAKKKITRNDIRRKRVRK